jgi:hypothetical protein
MTSRLAAKTLSNIALGGRLVAMFSETFACARSMPKKY